MVSKKFQDKLLKIFLSMMNDVSCFWNPLSYTNEAVHDIKSLMQQYVNKSLCNKSFLQIQTHFVLFFVPMQEPV